MNRKYGGEESDWLLCLIQTSDSGYACVGCIRSSGTGEGDFWFVKTDADGVIPEFPSFLILPLFFIATLLAVIVYRRRKVRCEAKISWTP